MIPRPGSVRGRAARRPAAGGIGLCALAIVLAACSSAVGTPPGGSSASSAASSSPATSPPPPASSGGSAAAPSLSVAAGAPSPSATPGATAAFSLLRMASAADPAKPAPDASTFTDSFSTSAPALYVVFALRSGLSGQVVCTLTANGVALIQPLTISYGATNSWGDFKISPKLRFAAGAYQATLRYVPSGELATINFTVR